VSVRLFSASIQGIDAQLIEVEVDSSPGIHAFNVVGLPDKAVQESEDRIASAIRNIGLKPPGSKNAKFVVNLAPADLKKEGASFDLPIAIAYLFESKQVKFDPEGRIFCGEVALDGTLKHVSGVLATAILAKSLNFREIIVPQVNAKEAAVIEGIDVIGAKTLKDVMAHLDGTGKILPCQPSIDDRIFGQNLATKDSSLLYIKGQQAAKRAMVVAAAGGHNLFMCGAPGAGKTILAKAFSELLPPLALNEAIEVAKIYSAIGMIKDTPLSFRRPFRNPHHTTSAVAVIGGGAWPKPGEISLAHRGVLFLDELPEFARNVLEALRQPLEEGTVVISRAAGSIVLPAKFTMVAAMNPCPCGNYGDESAICICSASHVLRYRKKVSGPLLDRMDIQINVSRETIQSTSPTATIEEVSKIKENIAKSRQIQQDRLKDRGILTNSEISFKNVDQVCALSPSAQKLLEQAINAKRLSMRTYHKIKKISRTIADLEQSEAIAENHVAEAINLRVNDALFSELA